MGVLTIRIVFYVIASAVDLVTTIALLNTGQAVEANPVAAQFAHNPVGLICFKTVVTCLVVLVACRLGRYRKSLAETTMAALTAFTIFIVVCGLATVPGPGKAW